MQFIYPGFLFALSALAIPLIIHLFNFRKFKRIYFTNVKFLREIKQETQSKSKLRHLLVLLSRMLAISFLVLAFAQPYLPVNNSTIASGSKVISIFVDNSFSMDALGNAGTLLEEAKKNASQIAAAYASSDRFQLLTNDFEGKHQRLLTRDEFLLALQEVKSSASVKSIQEILSRQSDLLNSGDAKNKFSYLISDFQKSNFNFENLHSDSGIQVSLLPLISKTIANVSIDTCWFESPTRQLNHPEVLHVRITNASENELENAPIKLLINKKQKALASFSVEANSTVQVDLTFTCKESGLHAAQLQLNDYPVSFDDTYFFSFDINSKIKVVSISEEPGISPISNLFEKDSAFSFVSLSQKNMDYNALTTANLIVLNELKSISSGLAQEIKRRILSGGSLLIFPAPLIDLANYQSFLSSLPANYFTHLDTANTRVDKVNYGHNIYNDVFDKSKKIPQSIDLPVVYTHYSINQATRSNFEYLMKLQNGEHFLGKNSVGKGKVYVSAVGLNTDFSNFSKHAMFVPTMYKIALYSKPYQQIAYTIGKHETVEIETPSSTTEAVFHVKNSGDSFDMVPEVKQQPEGTRLVLHNQLKQADTYLLKLENDTIGGFAFNYNRKESALNCYSVESLIDVISQKGYSNFSLLSGSEKGITASLKEINQGKRFWKWCLIAALFFLAVEITLLRIWKK